jgi:hypothetical protein
MKKALAIAAMSLFLFDSASAAPVLNEVQIRGLNQRTAPLAITDQAVMSKAFAAYNPGATPFEFYKSNKEQVLGELANHDVSLKAYSVSVDGKVSYLTSLLSGSAKKVVVQRDYINYKYVVTDNQQKKVGVIFRIEAELETKKADVDLNGLFAVGLAVKAGAASGQLRVKVHGLSGEPISTLIPSPSDVSEQSIQNAMEAVALLKAKMYDSKVNVIPQEIPE